MSIKGLFLILVSSFLFSGCSVIGKLIKVPSSEIVFIRSSIIFMMMLLLNIKMNTFGDRKVRPLLLVRGIFGSCCSLLYYYALQRMELGNVCVIFLNTSSMACLLSCIFGKRVTPLSIVSWLCMLLGALFMFRPESIFGLENPGNRIKSVIACYIAILFGGITICIVKRVVDHQVHYTCLITWATMSSSVVSGTMLLMNNQFEIPSMQDAILLLMLIIVSLSAQILLNKGIQLVNVFTGSFVSNFDIIISYILGTFVFHEYLFWTSYVSALLIFISAAVIAIDNYAPQYKIIEQEEREPLLSKTSSLLPPYDQVEDE